MGKGLVYILLGFVILLAGGLGYFIFQNQKLIGKISEPSPSPIVIASEEPSLKAPSIAPSPSPTLTLAELQANIVDGINSKNTAALASYMTKPKVNFIIMSSECCQPMTPDEAVEQLKYIDEGIPMDFNQNNQTIKDVRAKNTRLTNAFIGLSKSNEQLAAFTIDAQNRISQIEVAASWKLYWQCQSKIYRLAFPDIAKSVLPKSRLIQFHKILNSHLPI